MHARVPHKSVLSNSVPPNSSIITFMLSNGVLRYNHTYLTKVNWEKNIYIRYKMENIIPPLCNNEANDRCQRKSMHYILLRLTLDLQEMNKIASQAHFPKHPTIRFSSPLTLAPFNFNPILSSMAIYCSSLMYSVHKAVEWWHGRLGSAR